MNASIEALRAIGAVARRLGPLRDRVVFVGGAVRGLLITDPAVEASRATKDVDVIAAGITTRAEYYAQFHQQLRILGFKEDTSEGAPLCRWTMGETIVDVMPPVRDVLGFANQWYPHALDTALTMAISDGAGDPIEIRVVSAPSFLATKLDAFNGRGQNDFEASHDMEDIIALIDGRPSLLAEVEMDSQALRSYVAERLGAYFAAGIADAVQCHLAGDAASQGRARFVICTLERLRRLPRLLNVGDVVQSKSGGAPGANGPAAGPWRYELIGIERRIANAAREHVIVRVSLTCLGVVAGTVGDGRDVHIETSAGVRFPPLFKLIVPELDARGLPGRYDQCVPNEPFETCWVYEIPREARALRILLPFDGYELAVPG